MAKFNKVYNLMKVISIAVAMALLFNDALLYSYSDFDNNDTLRVPLGESQNRIQEGMREVMRKELHEEFESLAQDIIEAVEVGKGHDAPNRDDVLYEIEIASFYLALSKAFYRHSMPFEGLRKDTFYMSAAWNPEDFDNMRDKKELAERYNRLLQRYRRMIKWALIERLETEGKKTLVLYRGFKEDSLTEGRVFATESKETALKYAAKDFFVFHDVPLDAVVAYYDLYPDDLPYSLISLLEYNLDLSLIDSGSIKSVSNPAALPSDSWDIAVDSNLAGSTSKIVNLSKLEAIPILFLDIDIINNPGGFKTALEQLDESNIPVVLLTETTEDSLKESLQDIPLEHIRFFTLLQLGLQDFNIHEVISLIEGIDYMMCVPLTEELTEDYKALKKVIDLL